MTNFNLFKNASMLKTLQTVAASQRAVSRRAASQLAALQLAASRLAVSRVAESWVSASRRAAVLRTRDIVLPPNDLMYNFALLKKSIMPDFTFLYSSSMLKTLQTVAASQRAVSRVAESLRMRDIVLPTKAFVPDFDFTFLKKSVVPDTLHTVATSQEEPSLVEKLQAVAPLLGEVLQAEPLRGAELLGEVLQVVLSQTVVSRGAESLLVESRKAMLQAAASFYKALMSNSLQVAEALGEFVKRINELLEKAEKHH